MIFVPIERETMQNSDIIVQFARLWGQLEATVYTIEDEGTSDLLKSYDSKEMLNLLKEWSDEFIKSDIEDTCEFFYNKIKELIEKDKKA